MDRTYELITNVQAGDKESCDILVEENIGLIWSIVRKFMNRGYEADDLFQIGAIGLIKCIHKFDTSYDVKFSTYAVPMIMGEIKRFIRDDGIIKVSRPLKELAIKSKYMQEAMIRENGKTPTISEVAKRLEVNVEDLIVAMESVRDIESLYSTIHQGEGSPIYLIDKIHSNESKEEAVVDKLALKQIISQLKPKEKQIIILRYFNDKTQSEVAKIVGVSQVQVSRIEKKVLSFLRENLTEVAVEV